MCFPGCVRRPIHTEVEISFFFFHIITMSIRSFYLIQQALGYREYHRSVGCECMHLVEQSAERDLFGMIAIDTSVDQLKFMNS